jgi:uncharacterized protein YkwD
MGRRAQVSAAVLLVAAALVPAAATAPVATVVSTRPALASQVLVQVNALRARRGLEPLRPSTLLTTAAREHSLKMAKQGYFEHDEPDGTAFWRRIERYYPSHGLRYWAVGENLLWASPGIGAREALRWWFRSREHRKVLLNPLWREVGLSAIHSSAAVGIFRGLPVTIITADFGVRAT